ncbi:FRG domain-containing protein [Colwellia sp. MB02u-10]|uniref:FRG domain-containing protein n=1 Tax=Colwellia sp. MB02u-10 TaxID=2759828 RepID=UPI0015F3D8C4|nr:FRG domain-containing protein [Colwellia sp. MB02u-10]MBA6339729.1 FRG domain-containing protein [Colwellia sp. MB02u-10]
MNYEEASLERKLILIDEINPNGKKIIGVRPKKFDTHFEYEFGEDWEGFMNALDINRSELFETNNPKKIPQLLFRGQEKKEYELLPSAFRNLNPDIIKVLMAGHGDYEGVESDGFINFIEGMNAIGLHIEPESFEYINQLSDEKKGYSSAKFGDYAHGKMLKDLALAQHYGVPTRLLDFTLNPLVALFFATQGITSSQSKGNIGIWVIPEKLIEVVNEKKFVERIFVNGFQNRNMVAQKGLFINYIEKRGAEPNLYVDDKIKTLDQYLLSDLSDNQRQIVDERIGKPMLFTLSHCGEREITRYLDLININWTTIQPDLDGVKKEVERRKRKRLCY